MLKKEVVDYRGWKNCLRLSNGTVELVALTEAGPRIIHYGLLGGENQLRLIELAPATEPVEKAKWRPIGGHRLWVAPESRPYLPDNLPVAWRWTPSGFELAQAPVKGSPFAKVIRVDMAPSGAQVALDHRLKNCGRKKMVAASWGLTIVKPGGRSVMPLHPYGSHNEHVLPKSQVVLWAYSNLADPRVKLTAREVILKSMASQTQPQKLGVFCPEGRASYVRKGLAFEILCRPVKGASYPDSGSNFESFTRGSFHEIEALGPLKELKPGASAGHVEVWNLRKMGA